MAKLQAQHEVLGNDTKRDVRPASPESFRGKGRSKYSALGLAVASVAQATVYRPL